MNRRNVLRRLGTLLGCTIFAPALSKIFNGSNVPSELHFEPQFFNKNEVALICELTEIIIPKTATPGANDVGVPAFINWTLNNKYSRKARRKFARGMAEFNDSAHKAFGDNFVSCARSQRVEIVKRHCQLRPAQTGNHDNALGKLFVAKVRELALHAYFTR